MSKERRWSFGRPELGRAPPRDGHLILCGMTPEYTSHGNSIQVSVYSVVDQKCMDRRVIFIVGGSLASLVAVKQFIQWQLTQRHIEFVTWCTKERWSWSPQRVQEEWGKIERVGNPNTFNLLDVALWSLVATLAVMLVCWLFRMRPVGVFSRNLAILLIAVFSFTLIWNAGDYVGHNWVWISKVLHQ